MRVLVVSPTPTHPDTAGNRTRIRNYCDYFRKAGVDVAFLYYGMEGIGADTAPIHATAWDWYFECPFDHSLYPADGNLTDIDRLVSPLLAATVRNACDLIRPDAVICNYVWLSAVLDHVPSGTRKIIDTHDRFAARHDLLALSGAPRAWLSTSVCEEVRGLSRADRVWAITDRDCRYFARFVGPRATVVGHFQPLKHPVPQDAIRAKKLRIGFIGSDNVTNELAARSVLRAAQSCAPLHYASILIAGGVARRLTDEPLPPNVTLTDYFADIESFYETVDLVVAPIFFGTGLKIKTIEAMTFGKPIVAGMEAFAGIKTDCKYHLCRDEEQFLEAVAEVASDAEKYRQLDGATLTVFRRYNEQVINELDQEIAYFSRDPLADGGKPIMQGLDEVDASSPSEPRRVEIEEDSPYHAATYFSLAARLARAQELDRASSVMTGGFAIDPGCASTYLFAALLDMARGDNARAEANYGTWQFLTKTGIRDPGRELLEKSFVLPLVVRDPSLSHILFAKALLKAAQEAGLLAEAAAYTFRPESLESIPRALRGDGPLYGEAAGAPNRAKKIYPFLGAMHAGGSTLLTAVVPLDEPDNAGLIRVTLPSLGGISISDARIDDKPVNYAVRRHDGALELTMVVDRAGDHRENARLNARVSVVIDSPSSLPEATRSLLREQFTLTMIAPSTMAASEINADLRHVPFIDVQMLDPIAGEGWFPAEGSGLRWMSAKGIIHLDGKLRRNSRLLVISEGSGSVSGRQFTNLPFQLGDNGARGIVGFSQFGEWRYIGIIDVPEDDRPLAITVGAPFACAYAGPNDRRLVSVQIRRLTISKIVQESDVAGKGGANNLWHRLVDGQKGIKLRWTQTDGYHLVFEKSFEVTLSRGDLGDRNRIMLQLRRADAEGSPHIRASLNGVPTQFSLIHDPVTKNWLLEFDVTSPAHLTAAEENLKIDIADTDTAEKMIVVALGARAAGIVHEREISVRSITGTGLHPVETIGPGIEARWLSPRSEIELDVPEWMSSLEIEGVFERGLVKNNEVSLAVSGKRVIVDGRITATGFWSMRFNIPRRAEQDPPSRLKLEIVAPGRPLVGSDKSVSIMISKIRCHRLSARSE